MKHYGRREKKLFGRLKCWYGEIQNGEKSVGVGFIKTVNPYRGTVQYAVCTNLISLYFNIGIEKPLGWRVIKETSNDPRVVIHLHNERE